MLRSMAGVIAATAIFASTLAPHSLSAGPDRLTKKEVVTLINGNTLVGFDPKTQSEWVTFYRASGRAIATTKSSGQTGRVSGQWWVSDTGELCSDWESERWIDACYSVRRDDDTISLLDGSGRIVSFAELRKGNSEGL